MSSLVGSWEPNRVPGASLKVHGTPQASLGSPLGDPGAPLEVLGGLPGRTWATFWVPRSDPGNKDDHSGGSQGVI